MPFDSQEQRRIMGRFATGITVATTRVGDEFFGMTANAVTSLSLDPPLVLLCVDKRAQFLTALKESNSFALSILGEEHEHHSRRFAQKGPKEFTDWNSATSVTGAPILPEALAAGEGRCYRAFADAEDGAACALAADVKARIAVASDDEGSDILGLFDKPP